MKNKIKIGLAILGLGGTLIAGNLAGRPDCDYIVRSKNATTTQEICFTAEQAKILKQNSGFGGVKFGK